MNDIKFKIRLPSLSAKYVVSSEPKISVTANKIDDRYGSTDVPILSKIVTAYVIITKLAENCESTDIAKPIPRPFNAVRLSTMMGYL